MQNSNYYKIKSVFMLCSLYLIVPFPLYADTTVTNNVTVSADSSVGEGKQQATIRTVINGKVVEDWSTTSSTSIKNSSTHTTTDTASTTSTQTEQTALLGELLTRLQALISLYVTLITQQ